MPWTARSDLRRLSDADLASRCRILNAEIDTLQQARRPGCGRRGLLRHPVAYWLWGRLKWSDLGRISTFATWGLTGAGTAPMPTPDSANLHTALCELQDVVEEMQRRVAGKETL